MKHSPLQWRLDTTETQFATMDPVTRVLDANGRTVCDNQDYYPEHVLPEDQALIVRAVNVYDDVVEFLGRLIEERDHHAEHGCYTGKHFDPAVQSYDDWAADIAQTLRERANGGGA